MENNTTTPNTNHKVQIAIQRLQHFQPPEGYFLAFSGGKDSITIKKLADLAKVKYDAHYNNTTIDPPELIYFIRKHCPDVIIDNPKEPLLTRLSKRGFPTPKIRWCCEEYKENGGAGRLVVTGIRWQESHNRKNRQMVEHCLRQKTKRFLHVIIDWEESDVWQFIKNQQLPYCKLYDQGWKRIGCLLCPMIPAKMRLSQADKYPRYTEAFKKAFIALYRNKTTKGSHAIDRWKDGDDMFTWWLYSKYRNPQLRRKNNRNKQPTNHTDQTLATQLKTLPESLLAIK